MLSDIQCSYSPSCVIDTLVSSFESRPPVAFGDVPLKTVIDFFSYLKKKKTLLRYNICNTIYPFKCTKPLPQF